MSYNKKSWCSPHKKSSYDFTCYSLEQLKKIAKSYNKEYPDDKINLSQSKKELWTELKQKLKECNKETCWLERPFIKEKDKQSLKSSFVPPKPPRLLTTKSITIALKQYQLAYPSFKSYGAMPLDFEKLGIVTSNKIKRALNKYNKIGMVINMDKSNKPGSHWVAMYITPKRVEYFDSYGLAPPETILGFIKKLNLPFIYNKKRHQKSETECGMYSINFIIKRIKGKKFGYFSSKKIPDKTMRKYRNELFRD